MFKPDIVTHLGYNSLVYINPFSMLQHSTFNSQCMTLIQYFATNYPTLVGNSECVTPSMSYLLCLLSLSVSRHPYILPTPPSLFL